MFLPILLLASNQKISFYQKKEWIDFKDLNSFTGLKLAMTDNVPAMFGSLIDNTELEVSLNYFTKCLWTPMGLKRTT